VSITHRDLQSIIIILNKKAYYSWQLLDLNMSLCAAAFGAWVIKAIMIIMSSRKIITAAAYQRLILLSLTAQYILSTSATSVFKIYTPQNLLPASHPLFFCSVITQGLVFSYMYSRQGANKK